MVGPQAAVEVLLFLACLLSKVPVCQATLRETWAAESSHSLCPGKPGGGGAEGLCSNLSLSLGQATNLSTPSTPHWWTGEPPAPEAQRMGWAHLETMGGPIASGPSSHLPQTPGTLRIQECKAGVG